LILTEKNLRQSFAQDASKMLKIISVGTYRLPSAGGLSIAFLTLKAKSESLQLPVTIFRKQPFKQIFSCFQSGGRDT
jgi:hypothetical protein